MLIIGDKHGTAGRGTVGRIGKVIMGRIVTPRKYFRATALCVGLFGSLLAALFLFSAVGAENTATTVIVLTDSAGLGDKAFNDACWEGVLKAEKDFGVHARFLQSREQADYASNLALAARKADIVVTLGYLFADALSQVAPHFPGTKFIHMEGDIPAENVASFDFRSEEGGFLAGLTAGLFTKKNMVGVVAGMDIPPVEAYVSGYRAGVKTAEKTRGQKIEVVVGVAGSFNDPIKGKSLAKAMIDRGVDVIFKAAGNTGVGVAEAVKGANGVYLIADDRNQDAEMPGKVLTSALKRMDVAAYDAIRDCVEGRFRGGHRWLGASEGAVDITDMQYSGQLFAPADLERIEKAREALRSGKVVLPKRYGEVDSFAPPAL